MAKSRYPKFVSHYNWSPISTATKHPVETPLPQGRIVGMLSGGLGVISKSKGNLIIRNNGGHVGNKS